ncbi:MAG: HAMP domain-containing sensor histidine kinase [Candidatus Dormiibacterota bacterium]
MIWSQWRRLQRPDGPPPDEHPFDDLLEEAPVPSLLLDRDQLVVAANAAARELFQIDAGRLPLGLVEATREANLASAVTAGKPTNDLRLTHHRLLARTQVVPGPQPGSSLLFVSNITELRRLESVRQEFVANLAHELKTPITSLRLAVESLQQDLPAEARRRLHERALREVDYLSLVITNLRQLSALEAGASNERRERFDVGELIGEVRDRLLLTHPVEVDAPAGLWAVADRARLAQALANLMDNAVKFSPPERAIEVSARMECQDLVLRVRDHGPGISPEHWDRVFERFYKVDQAHSRIGAGSGLGLSIVRHLALSMEGSVWTEAAGDGGQIFGIRVPGIA